MEKGAVNDMFVILADIWLDNEEALRKLETVLDDFESVEVLVATITHQSHLCPLPLTVQPNIWNYDHCLYLYPTPHTIVLGDRSLWNAFKNTEITYFNTSSFSIDSTSVAYCPCSQEVKLLGL
ncbi:DNA polymerase epsilon subunit B [Glycine soja]|uniref:DNA polymerase II subunit 2 n=1 Tax=Glycine soja TaxID=3848 RepID=A0A445J252_GLYSO|nr:DNA polymerase epsilon subunit B [Glycine soja]